MKINVENIIKAYNKNIDNIKENNLNFKEVENFHHLIEKQNIKDYKENNDICKFEEKLMNGIDTVKLKFLYEKRYNEPEVLNTIRCLIHSILFGDREVSEYKLREWIKDPKIIGQGKNGRALLGSIISSKKHGIAKNFVIMKTPIIYQKEDHIMYYKEFLHETFIGINIANKLRENGNLNFSYTYGVNFYNQIISDRSFYSKKGSSKNSYYNKKEKIYSWGITRKHPFDKINENYDVCYILNEKIDNIGTLAYCLQNFDFKDIELESILNQIFFSLGEAYETFRFTHYDLHTGNILIKKTDIKYITYKFNNNIYNIKTNGYIPVFIDYDFCTGLIDGNYHGKYSGDYRFLDILPYEPNFFNDIFKVLLFVYYGSDRKFLSKYFNFFDVNLKEIENLQSIFDEIYYNLNREFTKGKTYSQFITYVETKIPKSIIKYGEGIQSHDYLSKKEIIEHVFEEPKPFTLIQLSESEDKDIDISKIVLNANLEMNKIYKMLEKIMDSQFIGKTEKNKNLLLMSFSDYYNILTFNFKIIDKLKIYYRKDKYSYSLLEKIYKINEKRIKKLDKYISKI